MCGGSDAERRAARRLLCDVVEVIDSGELSAAPGERAFLVGVLAGLEDGQPMLISPPPVLV